MKMVISIKSLLSVCNSIALITAGFFGILALEGLIDYEGADAATMYVGSDSTYKTIQSAISAASDGDAIYVKPGTYNENIVINTKGISLIGNDTANTIINGGGSGDVIRITADWVNVSGFSIINSGNSDQPLDAGIDIYSAQHVRITNVNSSSNNLGIILDSSDFCTVENNSCYYNTFEGIFLAFAFGNTIKNNSCVSNSYSGIYVYNSQLNTITVNNCNYNEWYGIWIDRGFSEGLILNTCNYNNKSGIYFQLDDSSSIENNICDYNNQFSIVLYLSEKETVSNNSCYSNNGLGMTFFYSKKIKALNNKMYNCGISVDGNQPDYWNSHTIDTMNTANGKIVYYWTFKDGSTIPAEAGQVILSNCTNIKIENQHFFNKEIGIEAAYSQAITISNNNVSNNVAGIVLYRTDSCSVTENICETNVVAGMRLVYSTENEIATNEVNSNEHSGIDLIFSNNNTVTNNSIKSNGEDGIYSLNSRGNMIIYNNISTNIENGIFLNESDKNIIMKNNISINSGRGLYTENSDNNDIYFNNFKQNTVQANQKDSDNNWDNGKGEGNYWSDYTGTDNGAGGRLAGDGIGDNYIPHLGLDNYPFVRTSGWLYPGIPVLKEPDDYDTDGNFTIEWNDNRGTLYYHLEEDKDTSFNDPALIYEGDDLFYNFTMKSNGTYYYRLKAFSQHHESDWSNIVNITIDWFPSAPVNFIAEPYSGGNALNISWDLNLIDTREYELYSNYTGTWLILTSLPHPVNSYNHTGLDDGNRYYYKIRARDFRDQLSGFSKIISGVPQDTLPPSTPKGLKVKTVTYKSITLVWDQSSIDDVAGYNIYRGNIINPSDWGDLIGTTGKGQEIFTDTNLTEDTTYYYVITAFDEVALESEYSLVVFNKTTKSLLDITIKEDTVDDTSMNLFDWFIDLNRDEYTFNFEGASHINISINTETGYVTFQPEENWNGNEIITFIGTKGDFSVSDVINVTVSSVNDAPATPVIILPKDGIIIRAGEKLNFQASCSDPDEPYGDTLTYTWTSSTIFEIIGTDSELTDVILPVGQHIIILEVDDADGIKSTAMVNVTVLKKNETAADDLMGIVVPSLIVIVIIVVLIIALFLIMRKRREKAKAEEVEEPTAPTVSADIYPPAAPEQPTVTTPTPIELIPPEEEQPAMAPIQPEADAVEPAIVEPAILPELPAGTGTVDEIAPFIDYTQYIVTAKAYLIISKESEFAFDIFEKYIEKTFAKGLLISRVHPTQLRSNMVMDSVKKVWLSQTAEEFSVSPTNLTKIAHHIIEFMKVNENCVIILDGLEYLINNNDFPKILKFIESVHEKIVLGNAVLLIPVNPSAMIKKDYELLETELVNKIKDPYYTE